MTVTNFFGLISAPFGAAVDHRVCPFLGRVVENGVVELVGEGSVQSLSHGEVLRCVVEYVLFFKEQVVNSSSVDFTGK